MAVRFLVETSKLRSTAQQFQSSATVWGNTIQNMLNTVSSTGCQWCGSAADSFRRKFAQHQQDRNDIINLINEHVRDLQEIAANYDRIDQDIAGQANSLRIDVVH